MQSRPIHFITTGIVALLATGCATPRNFPQASCRKTGVGYEIALSGMHSNMTHSITGYLRRPLVEEKIQFVVPRISGIVDGSEIPRSPGMYAYGGTMEFRPPQLFVDLHYIDTNERTNLALDWNGSYQLGECASSME